ncbi:MAG: sialate O-acetylesterase [Candidatus Acidiferrum sp.]
MSTAKLFKDVLRDGTVQRSMVLLLAWTLAPALHAEPRLPHLFSDHMVLQRDIELRIWGWADSGEAIEVSLADRSAKTVATSDGRWSVSFPPFHAGGPFALEVHGKKTLLLKDVVIGEVWVASGQSNMTYALGGAANAGQEVPKANDPELRFFTVPRRIAVEAQADTLPATWEVSTSDTAKNFSAVAYFFARDLRRSLGVPVGVILSAWPGTQGEEWTDTESLRRDPILRPIVSRWDSASTEDKAFAANPRPFWLEFDDFELLPAKPDLPPVKFSNFDDGSSRAFTGGSWSYSWRDAPDSTFELTAPGRGEKGYAAKISGALTGANDSRWEVRLHSDGTPVNLSAYSGIRFWLRGNGSLVFHTLQPSIADWDDYGSDLLKATPEWKEITILFNELKQAGWGVQEKLTLDQITGIVISAMTNLADPPRPPSGLYEGMIAPLVNFRIRGAIWYQGEGNTERAFQYRSLLPALIRGWRASWKEGDFPFLIVQLPNQGHSAEFADSWWAELRESQLFTAKTVPHTGLAVTIDVGEAGNLHPPRKEEVGARLALWALGTTFGRKVEYSGPLYQSMRVEGNRIRLNFEHTGSGLEAKGEAPQGFTIAGADRKFHHAAARIEGNSVMVSSPEVIAPVAVRYAWSDSPECNLYDKEGLPASPFRTDDWPGATFSNR